ncbi:unnamed protein product [Calicophoron daubneyi]|uniref:Regulator of microtubule dynamics protein 1 n=1 Tax=Calicophoron daubneyi TaxID=300641 RepID=A0AAV2TQD0_CALDB
MEELQSQFTSLRKEEKYQTAYDLIKDAIRKNGKPDPELCWREAVTCRDLALTLGKKDKKLFKHYVMEGMQAVEEGLRLDPNNARCHCWYGIFLNYVSELEGIKKKIENSYKIREHLQKCLEREPDYEAALHCMGRWCFEVTDLPSIQRSIAKTFFGAPPTSTYEEGLTYLLKAEKCCTTPNPGNDLYLAKTYYRLKDKQNCRHYCDKVMSSPLCDSETEQAKKEVCSIMKSL